MHERRVRVMGSDAVVVVVGGRGALADAAIARLHDLERRWSRFLPDSEVSRANAHSGARTRVSAETLALVERAELARLRTRGSFDPTLLHQVVDAGYDRDLSKLSPVSGGDDDTTHGTSDAASSASPSSPPSARTVHVDRRASTIRVPEGRGFDPGGIGKGWAADLVVGELLGEGAAGACVSVGGDLRVAGPGPDGDPWRVQVEDARDPGAPLLTLSLSDGAVATSSRMRRRWTRADGSTAHHLIDPRTGRPAATPVMSCTVVAAECWQAEALTKVAFAAGAPELLALLEESGATGLVVTERQVTRAPGLARFVLPAAHAQR
jgi:thiamine biosynthesis lipoprotein